MASTQDSSEVYRLGRENQGHVLRKVQQWLEYSDGNYYVTTWENQLPTNCVHWLRMMFATTTVDGLKLMYDKYHQVENWPFGTIFRFNVFLTCAILQIGEGRQVTEVHIGAGTDQYAKIVHQTQRA